MSRLLFITRNKIYLILNLKTSNGVYVLQKQRLLRDGFYIHFNIVIFKTKYKNKLYFFY